MLVVIIVLLALALGFAWLKIGSHRQAVQALEQAIFRKQPLLSEDLPGSAGTAWERLRRASKTAPAMATAAPSKAAAAAIPPAAATLTDAVFAAPAGVGEGVVDEAAELLAGGSDLGASGVVQAGQGGVLG